MNIFQIILWVIAFIIAIPIVFVVFVWLASFIFQLTSITNGVKHRFVKVILRIACFVLGIDVEVIGKEHIPDYKGEKGLAIIANHQSNFDILVLGGYLKGPIGFMAKIEIASWPIIGRWARIIGCTFIDRKNLRQSYGVVMGQTRENIAKGMGMVVFPAGTRSKNNEVLPFKVGSFKVATASGAPILPVSLVDVYKAPKANIFKRLKVKMIVHPVITEDEYKEMKSFDLAKQVEETIATAVMKYE